MSVVAPRIHLTLYPSHPRYVCGDGQYLYLGFYCEPMQGGAGAGVGAGAPGPGPGSGGRSFFDLAPVVEYTLRCSAMVAIDPASPAGRQHQSIAAAIDSFNATQDVLDMRTQPPTPSGAGVLALARSNFSPVAPGAGGGRRGMGPIPLPPPLGMDSLSGRVAGLLKDVDAVEVFVPSPASGSVGTAHTFAYSPTTSTCTFASDCGPSGWGAASSVPGGARCGASVTGPSGEQGHSASAASGTRARPRVKSSVPSPVSYTLGAPPPWASPSSASVASSAASSVVTEPHNLKARAPRSLAATATVTATASTASGLGGRRRKGRRGRKGHPAVPQQARDLVRSLVQLVGEEGATGSATGSMRAGGRGTGTCLPPVHSASHASLPSR
jgi:hypothetical protein